MKELNFTPTCPTNEDEIDNSYEVRVNKCFLNLNYYFDLSLFFFHSNKLVDLPDELGNLRNLVRLGLR